MARPEVFVSVDVEADGPIPGKYSMVSLGACTADGRSFYTEIKPISEEFVVEALAVSGLNRTKLCQDGAPAIEAMCAFRKWLEDLGDVRPVFVGFNASFDWMFVHWYFVNFLDEDPFGISGLDIKAYYMGAFDKPKWKDTAKSQMPRYLLSEAPHTHHALDDAREQLDVFRNVREANAERHFRLTTAEFNRVEGWRKKHALVCKYDDIMHGERYRTTFEPSERGMRVHVRCFCGDEKEVTER
jgi:ribonuclease T